MFAIDRRSLFNKRLAWSLGRLLFLAAAPITVPAHLQWMDAVSRTYGASAIVTRGVSVAIVYVLYRVFIDFVTDVHDLAAQWRARGIADPLPAPGVPSTSGKFKMSWRIYFLIAWFNLGETLMAIISLCAIIYGMSIVLHPPNPDFFYATQLGRPRGTWGLAFSVLVLIGPLAIFKSLEDSVLPLPYRWLGGKLIPSSQIEYPWQH